MTFSKIAEKLYSDVKNFEIKDFYARPKNFHSGFSPTNIWELIEDSVKTEMLKLCGFDLRCASDFEKLSMWCQCVSLMPDNAQKLIFREEITAVLGEDTVLSDACELWKKGNKALTFNNCAVANILRDIDANKIIYSDKSFLVGVLPINAVFDINLEINCFVKKSDMSLSEWSEDIICALQKKGPPYDIAVDIKDIKFVRGDHYHAGIAFEKLKSGVDINDNEKGQLFFWLLCYIVSKLEDNAVLHLNVGNNISCAEELVVYLCMRNICPAVAIGVAPESVNICNDLVKACLLCPKKIYLELVLGIEDTPRILSQRLEKLLSVYPAERLKFGGVLTDTGLLSASHRYARKIICNALSEIADEDAARGIVKALFS